MNIYHFTFTFCIFLSNVLYFAFQPKVIGQSGAVGRAALVQHALHTVLLLGRAHALIRHQNVEVQLVLAPSCKMEHAMLEIVLVSSVLVQRDDDLM